MGKGTLANYFDGVAAKTLSAVEADLSRSHQHEFNATKEIQRVLGLPRKERIPATYMYFTDEEDTPLLAQEYLTYYDARESHPTRSECRLYFPSNIVIQNASCGDLLIIARRKEGGLLVIVAEGESTIANQIEWLFGFGNVQLPRFSVRVESELSQDRLGFASSEILEQIGITPEEEAPNRLEEMLIKFGGKFTSTREFSRYARSTLSSEIIRGFSVDKIIVSWMDREEILFRTLERYLVGERLQRGFWQEDNGVSIDDFFDYALSVQNRRKSRAGHALENHLEALLQSRHLRYSRGAITENKSRPDFLFPGGKEYQQCNFSQARLLTMVGVKTTCKDRWRQILTEAERIPKKHLLTLQPAISEHQTDEMSRHNVNLVIPDEIQETYHSRQKTNLMKLEDLFHLIRERQEEYDRIS